MAKGPCKPHSISPQKMKSESKRVTASGVANEMVEWALLDLGAF